MLTCLLLIVGIPALSDPLVVQGKEDILGSQLKNWTDTFGNDIFNFGNVATRYDELQKRFQTSNSVISQVNLKKVVEEMAVDTFDSLNKKVDAIKKTVRWAEEKALEYFEKQESTNREIPPKSYLNAKKINFIPPPELSAKDIESMKQVDPLLNQTIELRKNLHFGAEVNLESSSVHVPSFVFDRRDDILDGIHWTAGMDDTFRTNYAKNPTLHWQYFGSSSGFLRQYPAMKWPKDNTDKHDPDIYDCRSRPWYTGAANSPKNIVILQDVSGSMMGLRREIARHVVYTILDTLTENDYVSVLNFTTYTSPVAPCFKDTLVQANLENIREFKVALEQSRTKDMANFTEALNTAYALLDKHRDSNRTDSANCNEAIMLITDGVPDLFNSIFNPRNEELPGRTRVFTYLIGRDVTEKSEILHIACTNRGYFAHVTTLGEVEEQVLKYLALMSRPMVMANSHTLSWTNVYADIVDINEVDWVWDEKNREKQKDRSRKYKLLLKKFKNDTEKQEFYLSPDEEEDLRTSMKGKKPTVSYSGRRVAEFLDHEMIDPPEDMLRELLAEEERQNRLSRTRRTTSSLTSPSHLHPPQAAAITLKKQNEILLSKKAKLEAEQENLAKWGPKRKFRFMVSTSLPVFDRRNITEERMPTSKSQAFNETIDDSKDRIAIFLGVVGTDIPIAELQKLASPFKIGVNGYAFAVTENGFVLFHPDWRPLFMNDLLKPNYNAVDLTKIELADSDIYKRNTDPKLMKMRHEIIHMENDDKPNIKTLAVRVPLDDFRRVVLRQQDYAYVKIVNTSYTLVVTLPTSQQYELSGEMEIRRDLSLLGKNLTQFFELPHEPRQWRVNPDWCYCDYLRGSLPEYRNKEELVLHFLDEIQRANHSWPWRNTGIGIHGRQSSLDSQVYICDKKLMQSLVFDANITGVYNMKWWRAFQQQQDKKQIIKPFRPVVGFIATRSGLTRWVNYNFSDIPYLPFTHSDIKATEEVWYKRAVSRYEVDRGGSFVVSVPYDAGTRQDSFATATRAIFVHRSLGRRGTMASAPAAVTGVQFEHGKMAERFFNITQQCTSGGGCLRCRENLDCFVLDDNGYVVISSDKHEYTGQFFGNINGEVMEQLVNIELYKRVHIVDYQAICYHFLGRSGFGVILQTPFRYFQWLIKWVVGRMAWLAIQINLHSFFSPDFASVLAEVYPDEEYSEEEEKNPNWHPFFNLAPINKTRLRPCHKEYYLHTYGKKYYADLYNTGYYPGMWENCDGQGQRGFYGVHLINRTNLILVAISSMCRPTENKKDMGGQEVQYTIDEEIQEEAKRNDILNQICRAPYEPLERKRPTSTCYAYNEEEVTLREECGSAHGLLPTLNLLIFSVTIFLIRFHFCFNVLNVHVV